MLLTISVSIFQPDVSFSRYTNLSLCDTDRIVIRVIDSDLVYSGATVVINALLLETLAENVVRASTWQPV